MIFLTGQRILRTILKRRCSWLLLENDSITWLDKKFDNDIWLTESLDLTLTSRNLSSSLLWKNELLKVLEAKLQEYFLIHPVRKNLVQSNKREQYLQWNCIKMLNLIVNLHSLIVIISFLFIWILDLRIGDYESIRLNVLYFRNRTKHYKHHNNIEIFKHLFWDTSFLDLKNWLEKNMISQKIMSVTTALTLDTQSSTKYKWSLISMNLMTRCAKIFKTLNFTTLVTVMRFYGVLVGKHFMTQCYRTWRMSWMVKQKWRCKLISHMTMILTLKFKLWAMNSEIMCLLHQQSFLSSG